MNFARPKSGFLIRSRAAVGDSLAEHSAKWPRLAEQWQGITERLAMTGHREGAAFGEPGERVFEAQGDHAMGIPTIRVAYHVLGDTITFLAIDVV